MVNVITDVGEVTPRWLTELLRRSGHLSRGEVVEVQVLRTGRTGVSTVHHLSVRYAGDEPVAPTRLFLKIPDPDREWTGREIEFYRVIAPAMLGSPGLQRLFPECYDVAQAPDPTGSHLLLADLSPTHFTHGGKGPPTARLGEMLIDTYAVFHAFWWEHSRLGRDIGQMLTEETIEQFLAEAQRGCESFARFPDSHAGDTHLAILRRVAAAWPERRRQRVVRGRGVTLVHRDPHPGNFLYPRNPDVDSVVLVDWQSWRVDTGTDDLAYAMACHWPLAPDSRLEWEMVRRYHRTLLARGVANYTWDECWYDYRASIVRCLFFLLVAWSPAQWEGGMWWERVRRGIGAFRRWDCGEIL